MRIEFDVQFSVEQPSHSAKYNVMSQMNFIDPRREMERAFLNRDSTYDGIFVTGVRTTGIFSPPFMSSKKTQRRSCSILRNGPGSSVRRLQTLLAVQAAGSPGSATRMGGALAALVETSPLTPYRKTRICGRPALILLVLAVTS